jgi:hypothetical protein
MTRSKRFESLKMPRLPPQKPGKLIYLSSLEVQDAKLLQCMVVKKGKSGRVDGLEAVLSAKSILGQISDLKLHIGTNPCVQN